MEDAAIVLVGCGTIGGMLLRGWRASARCDSITVIDPAPRNCPDDVVCLPEAPANAAPPRVLALAIKPQTLASAAPGLAMLDGAETIVLSVLAAVDIVTLRRYFPKARAIVRAVPNLPGAIGQGVTALHGAGLPAGDRLAIDALVAVLGPTVWLDDEALIDAATAVSGCGPGFLLRYADAVIRAGVGMGLDPGQARTLIAQTMIGAGHMLRDGSASAADMARAVASPGGVTQAGLDRLGRDDALVRLIAETLAAAAERNAAIAEDCRLTALRQP